jgi:pilus assembly protein CpaB
MLRRSIGRDGLHSSIAGKAHPAMRGKSILLLMVALGCGMIAAVAVSKTMMDRDSQPQTEATIEILVATREVKTANQITADSVRLEKWPRSKVPEGAITDLAMVEGKFARQGIFPGEPILIPKLADSNSSLSTQIPAGHTLFNIVFDNNYIKPGDIVDISGIFKCNKTKRTEVKTVLREVQVFAINGISDREHDHKGGRNTVFQLLIKQNQSQALMLANNMGKLELNLRPLSSKGQLKDLSDDGQEFLAWAMENGDESAPEPTAISATTLVTAPAPPADKSDAVDPNMSELLIVTPDGVTRYEFSEGELPRQVREDGATKSANSTPNPWSSHSGYGGYSPTYPNAPEASSGPTATSPSAQGSGTTVAEQPGEVPPAPGKGSMVN